MTRSHRSASRGVSLIEALVALVVMSVGLLGVVGMQISLRNNADVSRQRSEAVRMAEEKIEALRAFQQLDTTAGQTDFTEDIVSSASAEDVTPSTANATFQRSVTVHPVPADGPQMKTLSVTVRWWDRRATAGDTTDPGMQSIVMHTAIAKVAPALGAALGLPTGRSGLQRANWRHLAIPRNFDPRDVTITGPTTTIRMPTGVSWVFNNETGRITRIGTRTLSAVLITGYFRFATSPIQPTGVQSEAPPSNANATDGNPIVPVGGGTTPTGYTLSTAGGGIALETIRPVRDPGDFAGGCVVGPAQTLIGEVVQPYYCAVPIISVVESLFAWTGTLRVLARPAVAEADASDNRPNRYRLCRYSADPTTDTPAAGNGAHPLVYTAVSEALTNQNFLFIRAGNGTDAAFTCPTDNTSTPLADGDTRYQAQR